MNKICLICNQPIKEGEPTKGWVAVNRDLKVVGEKKYTHELCDIKRVAGGLMSGLTGKEVKPENIQVVDSNIAYGVDYKKLFRTINRKTYRGIGRPKNTDYKDLENMDYLDFHIYPNQKETI